jgi:hypothetical protein
MNRVVFAALLTLPLLAAGCGPGQPTAPPGSPGAAPKVNREGLGEKGKGKPAAPAPSPQKD